MLSQSFVVFADKLRTEPCKENCQLFLYINRHLQEADAPGLQGHNPVIIICSGRSAKICKAFSAAREFEIQL